MRELEWINVKERPPDNEYLDCMVVVKVGDYYAIDRAAWTLFTSFDLSSKKRIQYWDWTISVDWDEGQGCEVVYWMPYPKLPDEIEAKMLRIDDHAIPAREEHMKMENITGEIVKIGNSGHVLSKEEWKKALSAYEQRIFDFTGVKGV